jgi:hypothetical protein
VGEIDSDADIHAAAEFFLSTLSGIRIAAKSGQSRKVLRSIAAFAGMAFRHHSLVASAR